MYKIDLNSDIGESFGAYRMGDDAAVMDAVTSANVACGFHAGDPLVMNKTIKNCAAKGVAVGAHPGYPDLVGFGRRNMKCTPEEEYADCLYQIGALSASAARTDLPCSMSSLTGDVQQAAKDPDLQGVARAVKFR